MRWLPENAFSETIHINETSAGRTMAGTGHEAEPQPYHTARTVQADETAEAASIEYSTFEEFLEALSRRGYRSAMIDELISLLRQRVPELIDGLKSDISEAPTETTLDGLARNAHTAKGILNSIEMNETGNAALEAERAARAGEEKTARNACEILIRKLEQLAGIL